jgi:hypothetical protein
MRAGRRLLAVSLALVLAAPAGVSARDASGQQAAAAGQRLAERIAGAQARETPAEELLAGVLGRDRDEIGAHGRALRTFLSETWLADEPEPGDAPDDEDEEPVATGAVAWPWPAGDLTGDGRSDVLVESWSWSERVYLLQALRGSDGQELWRIESDGWDEVVGWPARTDLTGDGADDLLIWTWSWGDWDSGDECGDGVLVAECTSWFELTYTWTLGVRSGSDGALAWSQSFDGAERWEQYSSSGPLGYEWTHRVEATNALVLPYLSGDHDGDGLDDLVLNVVGGTFESTTSSQGLLLAHQSEESERLRATTRASIVTGATGASTAVRTVEDAPRVGHLRPADPDGADLLWQTWTAPDRSTSCERLLVVSSCSAQGEAGTAELEMLDGATLSTRWQRPADIDDWVFPLGADLDGDGHAELLVERSSYDEDEDEWRHVGEILSGADGQALWERDDWWWPWVVGSLDGSPGADLLIASSEYEDGRATVTAERVDGATGATLFTTAETVEVGDADDAFVWFWPLGDGTGDGVTDIGWEAHRIWWDEHCTEDEWGGYCWYELERIESRLRAEATSTGATLYTSEPNGYAELWPAGDLDGDGAGEAFEIAWGDGATSWTAVDLTGGVPLWSMTFDGWARLMPAGDQTGDGGSDVLLQRVGFDEEHFTAKVAGLDGSTAFERWSVRYGDQPDSAA